MANEIDQVTAIQFSSTLYQLAQQKESKFASKVRRESVSSAEFAYFDTIAAEDAPEAAVTRHGPTPLSESVYGRRKVLPSKWHKGTMLDSYDLARMKENPQGAIVQNFARSFGRKKDDLIIAAALGSAAIGKTGATTVAGLYAEGLVAGCPAQIGIDGTASTGAVAVRTADNTLPAVGTIAAMDLGKILTMLQLFNEGDVDEDLTKYWAVSPTDIATMLDLTEVGSADYNTVKALAAGKVESFCGFNFFWTNRLLKDAATGTGWRTFAFTEDAIVLAYIADLTTELSKRADLCNETQIYSQMDLGAVRMEGVKIHECITKV